MRSRINNNFFTRDVLEVAPALLGMKLICYDKKGLQQSFTITETEAYRGEEDLACHVSKGRTARTEIMYHEGGVLYVYLVYGMHWMLNIVTGRKEVPQAVLLRGIQGITGPGRLTKALGIDKSFNGENMSESSRIWLEDRVSNPLFITTSRIGIDYAGPEWKNKQWRFIVKGLPEK